MPPIPSLHAPPADRPADLPELVPDTAELWRLHDESDLTDPPRRPPRWRFDAPAEEFAVTYANESKWATFAETYGDTRAVPVAHGTRLLSSITASRPLRVLALDDPEVVAAFDLQLDICSTRDYALTQKWSKAWHDWYGDEIDGVRYVGRKAITKLNYCLFLDRTAPVLEPTERGRLKDLRADVLKACAMYRLRPLLYAGTL